MAPRSHIFSIVGLCILALYGAAYYGYIEQSFISKHQLELVPVWALTFVATICILDIAKGVLSLDNAEGAHQELMKDIKDAKADLRSKGVKVE